MARRIKLPNGKVGNFPDDMSNEDIELVLRKQFPPTEKLNESPEESTGLSGVLSDIEQSVSEIPEAAYDLITNLPGQIKASGKQIFQHPLRAIGNVGAGLLEGAKGAYNLPLNIADYLGDKDIAYFKRLNPLVKALKIGNTGLEQAILGSSQEGDELLQSLGAFAPYAKLGGMGRGLKGAVRRGGVASAFAAGQNEDPLKAALLGLAGEGAVKGIQKITKPESFLPSSPLSAEELQNAARITEGTETSLGSVIDNPFLQKQFENIAPNIPFSGANQAMQRTANLITEKGNTILDKLKGDFDTSDISGALRDALKKAEQDTRKTKNQKFLELNEAAEKEGVLTDRSNMRTTAKQALKKIQDDPDLSLLTDNKTKILLNNLAKEKGKGNYSLKETDFLRGKLGDMAHDMYMANDSELSGILGSLKTAAEKDINSAIDKSGNAHLDKLRSNAMKFYKENYAPFEDPEIMKFTKKGGDPDVLMTTFLKNSRLSDRSRLLSKLSQKLTNDQRNLLAYSYLSKAMTDGKLNPLKFKTLFNNLGEGQKKALLGNNEAIKQIKDYSTLIQKNTEPLNIMFNPKTGQRSLSELPLLSVLSGASGALATGSVPGGILATLLPGLLARPLVKAVTSPKIRDKVINRLIQSKIKNASPSSNLSPLIQSLMASQANNPMNLELNEFQGYE